ncbi:MAG: response regulator [Opitutaceae bacterium]|nr:response regulator [Opitutaceae bacterium]
MNASNPENSNSLQPPADQRLAESQMLGSQVPAARDDRKKRGGRIMNDEQTARAKKRILVVDDDAMVRDVLVHTLETLGHDAQMVVDSRETLALVANFKPHAILLDIVMPDRDGFELLGELRIRHPEVPVIAMTGGGRMAASQLLRLATMLGATGILPKPFSLDAVEVTLSSLFESQPKSV